MIVERVAGPEGIGNGVSRVLRVTQGGVAAAPPVDPTDVAALFRAHGEEVARWAARLYGPHADVDDIVQEVFLIAHRRLPAFVPQGGSVRTWLYRTTAHLVARRRRWDRVRRLWRGDAPDPDLAHVPSPAHTPIEELAVKRWHESLYRVLDGLDDKYRSVLVLYELEERSGPEIAELLQLNLSTVWVRLHRARALFLKRMRGLEARGRIEIPEGGHGGAR